MRLFRTVGRLPGTWLAVTIILFSGISEGIGLTLFVPLLELMSGTPATDLPQPFVLVSDAFSTVGLPTTVLSLLAAIVIVIISSLGLNYAQSYVAIRARNLYGRQLRHEFVDALFNASWTKIAGQSHGDIINQFIIECRRAATALFFEVLCVASLLQIIIYVGFSSALSWELMIVTLLFGGLVVAVVYPLQQQAKRLGEATSTANHDLSFFGLDFLKGAKLIKASAAERTVLHRLSHHIEAFFKVYFLSELNYAQIYLVVQALPVLLLASIIAIAHDILRINPSFTLVFLLVLVRLAPKVAQFQQYYQGFSVAVPAVEIVDDALESFVSAEEHASAGQIAFQRLSERVVVDGVSYSYPQTDESAIKAASLEIERNQLVALVGSSGSGKSTLIDLITGLRRTDRGRILIDGVDQRELDIRSWRRRIGYVTQDVVIFNDTLRENLRFGNTRATDADIAEAMAVTDLDQIVNGMPDGLDTVLGESGVRLSGGQKQRVALTRSLVGKPEVLFLDEATSALDTESEHKFQLALERIAHTMTIVVVAHRLSTVRKADIICVMERGRIVEMGTHDALLNANGRFAELYDIQFS